MPAPSAVQPATHIERELIVACARTRLEPDRAERVCALARAEVDWQVIEELASAEGLRPLLCWHLSRLCPDSVPPEHMQRLQAHFQANAQRNLFLAGELVRLVRLLGEHGIGAVPFKGPALAVTLYGNLALREFVDLDVLVHRPDIPRARDVLLANGYGPDSETTDYDLLIVRSDGRVTVELHWAFAQKFHVPVDPAPFWSRLETAELCGSVVQTLAPADLLLVLCLHGAKHRWGRLNWLCDVAQWLDRYPQADWPALLGQAHSVGLERIVLLGLHLAGEVIGVALPGIVAERVRADRAVAQLAAQARAHLFCNDIAREWFHEEWSYYINLSERPGDRLRRRLHFVRSALKPSDAERALLPLPKALGFLHYAVRPVRLAGKYARRPQALVRLLASFVKPR